MGTFGWLRKIGVSGLVCAAGVMLVVPAASASGYSAGLLPTRQATDATAPPSVLPPGANDDKEKEALENQLVDLKSKLDTITTQKNAALTELDNLKGKIDQANQDITRTSRVLAATESAIVKTRRAISFAARELYRHPLTKAASILDARSIDEALVIRKYLGRSLSVGSDVLKFQQRARENATRLRATTADNRKTLDAARIRQESNQRSLDESLRREQTTIGQLETKLAQAKAAKALPWATLPNCPTVVPHTETVGPYNIEDWAVATLKSIALRTGRSEGQALTAEHVLALISFARGEGGGTQGHAGQYNPLNLNGWTRLFPELGGTISGRGTDIWPSFDAGVEATARALTSKQYSRLTKVLVDPNASAAQFFFALATPDAYAGNKNWSENDGNHLDEYGQIVQTTRSDYARWAGLMLDPPGTAPSDGSSQVAAKTPRGLGLVASPAQPVVATPKC